MCRAPPKIRLRDEPEDSPQQPQSEKINDHRPVRTELLACLKLAFPLACVNLLERVSLWITWALIGRHGGADDLGPASLASTVNNVLGLSVNIGLSFAVQTLASQAAGAGDARALGRTLQRALPVSVVFSLPVTALLLFLGPLLTALGRPADFCARASSYALVILPVAALTGAQRSMTAWLAALQITRPLLIINIALVPFHALLAWCLVYYTPMGYLGAGAATSIQAALRVMLTYSYIRSSSRCKHAWPNGFQPSEAFSGWSAYLRLALPGVLFMAEFWVGEFLVFTAALLPSPAVGLSAFAVYQLTMGTCYQPPGGIRVAVSSRVGRFLGAADPIAAQRTWHCGVMLVLMWMGLPTAVLLLATRSWALIFTTDERVVALLTKLVPWLVTYVGLDALLAVGSGAFTGCGRQGLGGRMALLSYVAIGLPLALALGFGTELAVVGIAMGHTLGKLVMTLATLTVVARTDWGEQSDKAIARVKQVLAEAPAADVKDEKEKSIEAA